MISSIVHALLQTGGVVGVPDKEFWVIINTINSSYIQIY